MQYKVKTYERIEQIVDESGKVNSWVSEDKMNVKEEEFVKVYCNQVHVSEGKYKDFFLMTVLSKYMNECNVVHIDSSLRDVVQVKMGNATTSAVSNGLKNLVEIGFIYKVMSRKTHKLAKGTYFLSPYIVSKSNSGLTQNLRSYLDYNKRILKDKTIVINPIRIGNKIELNEYSDIPEELLKDSAKSVKLKRTESDWIETILKEKYEQ